VDKIMNLIAEDQAMWLVHVQTWKNAKVIQKECWWTLERATQL
jgi:hypothetical protein